MPKNKVEDLRDHLFATIEALQDEDKPMDIERARAIADVARVIVDTAKVEVAFLNVTGGRISSGFLPQEAESETQKPRPKLAAGGAR